MKQRSRNTILILLALLAIMGACRKPTLIGEGLIPPEDQLNSERQDTFTVITTVLREDSAVTNFNLFFPLGSLDQEFIGKSSASLYIQPLLPTNDLFLGEEPVIDSIVLVLDYAALYGDTNAVHSVNVYKVIEEFDRQSNYLSDQRLLTLPEPIGRKAGFVPNLDDSVDVLGVRQAPQLRIRLSDGFAQQFGDDSDTVKFQNDTTFTQFLKGLYVEADTSGGHSNSIMVLNLQDANSGLVLYYSNETADSLQAVFPLFGNRFSTYTHDYTGTEAGELLSSPDPPEGDSILYLQGLTGLKAKVTVPYLDSLDGIAINKAEFVFPLRLENDTLFPAPGRLLLIEGDSLNRNEFFYIDYNSETYISVVDQDFLFSGINYDYGGQLDTVVNRNGESIPAYRFNLTRHFQKILQGDIDNDGFMLIVYPGYRIPNAVTLYGTGTTNEDYSPYLSITFTYVNQ